MGQHVPAWVKGVGHQPLESAGCRECDDLVTARSPPVTLPILLMQTMARAELSLTLLHCIILMRFYPSVHVCAPALTPIKSPVYARNCMFSINADVDLT